jgi:hypothetical protein
MNKWDMSKKPTKDKYIPIADCPNCKIKDTPLSYKHLKMTHKDTKEELDLKLDKNSQKHIKGYISINDLKNTGYEEGLVKPFKRKDSNIWCPYCKQRIWYKNKLHPNCGHVKKQCEEYDGLKCYFMPTKQAK